MLLPVLRYCRRFTEGLVVNMYTLFISITGSEAEIERELRISANQTGFALELRQTSPKTPPRACGMRVG